MLVANPGQAFEQALPHPALPGLVRAERPIAARPPPALPARQPVAPVGEIAVEPCRQRVGERQPREGPLLAHPLAHQRELRGVRQFAQQLHQQPAHAFGLERRSLRKVAQRRAHRAPQPSAGELGAQTRADPVSAGVAALKPSADPDAGHDHRALGERIASARRGLVLERVEQRVGEPVDPVVESDAQRHGRSGAHDGRPRHRRLRSASRARAGTPLLRRWTAAREWRCGADTGRSAR